eukprot:COSAG01_NODE_470_length_16575_cov_5.572408_19_plen_42_part_00
MQSLRAWPRRGRGWRSTAAVAGRRCTPFPTGVYNAKNRSSD